MPIPFVDRLHPHLVQALSEDDDKTDIKVAFLPHFFVERHGIAFWECFDDSKHGQVLGSACVTPCSEGELRHYGLIEYIDPEEIERVFGPVRSRGLEGVDMINGVGVDQGRWLEKDVVEDWE